MLCFKDKLVDHLSLNLDNVTELLDDSIHKEYIFRISDFFIYIVNRLQLNSDNVIVFSRGMLLIPADLLINSFYKVFSDLLR